MLDMYTVGLGILGAGGAYLAGYRSPGIVAGAALGALVGYQRGNIAYYIGIGPAYVADLLSDAQINRAVLRNGGEPYTDVDGRLWTFDDKRKIWTSPITSRVRGVTELTRPDPALVDAQGREQLSSIAANQAAFMAYKRQYEDVKSSDVSGAMDMPNPNDFYKNGRFLREAYEAALSAWNSYNRNVSSRKWADSLEGFFTGVGQGAANVGAQSGRIAEAAASGATGGMA